LVLHERSPRFFLRKRCPLNPTGDIRTSNCYEPPSIARTAVPKESRRNIHHRASGDAPRSGVFCNCLPQNDSAIDPG
jgi:hypothetical protein